MKSEPSLLYRATLVLLFCTLFVIALYYAQGILVPLVTAALLAMLLLPLVRRFERWKLGKFFSILVTLLIVIGIVVLVIYILTTQVVSFSEDLPAIQEKLNQRFSTLQETGEDRHRTERADRVRMCCAGQAARPS